MILYPLRSDCTARTIADSTPVSWAAATTAVFWVAPVAVRAERDGAAVRQLASITAAATSSALGEPFMVARVDI
jgi:hypothetical protein